VRRFAWILGVALLGVAGATMPASAQLPGDTELARNWDFRLGFFVPERTASRSKEGDVWLSVGAERAIYEIERWRGTISVDYYGSGSLYNIPVTINVRGDTNRLRYGAGAGVAIGHDLDRGITNFAYNLLLGYSLLQGPRTVFFDVRYMGVGGSRGELNGWSATLGMRF
jgi:hypothetical protein